MTTNNKKRKKQLLALFLSAMFASSFAFSLAACKDDESEKPSQEEETEDTSAEKDDARLTNGSFEFFNDNDGKNLIITSPSNWSRSNDAGGSTSKAASGIINTENEAWNNLTTSSGLAHKTADEAETNWDNLTAKDKLEFYKEYEDEDELDFYESFNIDIDDVPTCNNPGTHYASTDEAAADNTNVLMIHNDYNVSGKYGTAQKFTSSTTITVAAGTYAELSVWVKTSDLKFSTSEQEVIRDRGAYIDVTQTVGGTTLDTLQVKNINTELQGDANVNNGWVNYTFYLQGCSYATSTFKVVLGLGQSKVSTNVFEYVSGYAFFDDIECKIYNSNSTENGWTTAVNKVASENRFDMNTDKDKKIVNADDSTANVFSMDMDKTGNSFSPVALAGKVSADLTKEKAKNGNTYVSAAGYNDATNKLYTFGGLTLSATNDVKQIVTSSALPNNTLLTDKIKDDLKTPDAFNSEEMLLLLSGEGVAYTAKVTDSTFSVEAGKYLAFSFFVKTSDLAGYTGAGVKFIEVDVNGNVVGNESSLAAMDTTSITAVDVDTDEGKQEDIYLGWQQCFYFLENDTEETRYFTIELTYGATTIVGTTNDDYYGGYAAFANFESREINEKEYGYASEGTYSKKFSLTGKAEEETNGSNFDEASTVGGDIEKGLANPINYKGVNGGSGFVNGTSTDAEVNGNEYAGLINKDEIENWESNAVNDEIKSRITKDLLGDATQPLLIYNTEAKSYGFIGASQTISANTYATVSVRVMVSPNATANVYLIDTNDETHESSLSWSSGRTYWYDDDGNICVSDPSSKDFKKTDVAFKLQPNGLYQVNTKWSGYAASGVNANDYYANLSNYEGYGKNEDLLVKEGGVSYNYTANWQNDGNDGVAFYYNDGKYYAYSDYTTEVKNLENVVGLTPRYEAQSEKTLTASVSGAEYDNTWVTVTFYLHTGSQEKNYRLEVWSGTRDGATKNPSNSYVLFDASGASTLTDDTFPSLIEEAKENIEFSSNLYSGEFVEGVYSFYDDTSFLRYDETIDDNGIGNSYENYLSSAYESGTAYMTYEDKANLIKVTFVDFNLSEVTVAADIEEDETETEEEDTTTPPSETNMWLLISSIVIAVVLMLAVVSIIVRKFVEKARRRKAREVSVKSVAPARKVKAKKAKPEKKETSEVKDENDPYND